MAAEWTIEWEGASGTKYKYWIYPVGTPHLAQGGNYVFAKETQPNFFVPIYFGQTNNLDIRFDGHHKKDCITRAGATHIHSHLNPNEKNRLAEEADLIAKWSPPCNG